MPSQLNQNQLMPNQLTQNQLTPNWLTLNQLTINQLMPNQLTLNQLTQDQPYCCVTSTAHFLDIGKIWENGIFSGYLSLIHI